MGANNIKWPRQTLRLTEVTGEVYLDIIMQIYLNISLLVAEFYNFLCTLQGIAS